jgi:hypothetical protein
MKMATSIGIEIEPTIQFLLSDATRTAFHVNWPIVVLVRTPARVPSA